MVCSVCAEQDEKEFRTIKEYLYNNPGATMSEVSTVLDIKIEKIKRYLREGRLEILNDDGNLILECENCGKSIKTGRFCENCAKDMTNQLRSTARSISKSMSKDDAMKKNLGMRYLSKDVKKK